MVVRTKKSIVVDIDNGIFQTPTVDLTLNNQTMHNGRLVFKNKDEDAFASCLISLRLFTPSIIDDIHD